MLLGAGIAHGLSSWPHRLSACWPSGDPNLNDATLAENIANKTENDGIAETGEFYYVEIPTQVDSGVVDFVEVTIMTDGVDLIDVEYEVEQVVDITVDAAVETTNIEDVGVAVSQTAPAP